MARWNEKGEGMILATIRDICIIAICLLFAINMLKEQWDQRERRRRNRIK